MAGFTYEQYDSNGVMANYVAFGGATRRSHVRQFEIETADNLVLTGFGFEPECVIVFGCLHQIGEDTERARLHMGVATSPTDQWTMEIAGVDNQAAAIRYGAFKTDMLVYHVSSSLTQLWTVALASFDADGVTLDLDVPGAGTIPMVMLALAGGGNYACGVETIPGTTGSQVVEVGFSPDCVFFGSNGHVVEEGDEGMSWSAGAADTSRQFNYWMGGRNSGGSSFPGARNTASINVVGSCITIGDVYTVDDGGGNTHGEADLLAQASMDALGSDDFTLDWTLVDGEAYKYGWLAVENSATDRFEIATGASTFVTTPVSPVGLLGYNTQAFEAEDADPGEESFISGAAASISAADEDAASTTIRELSCSCADYDAPDFGVQQNVSDMEYGVWGCVPRSIGFPYGHQDAGHLCNIIALTLDVVAWVPQIYRRVAPG